MGRTCFHLAADSALRRDYAGHGRLEYSACVIIPCEPGIIATLCVEMAILTRDNRAESHD